MTNRVRGERNRLTTVCIDSYENGVMNGRIYHPHLEQGRPFRSTIQFLTDMEQLLDRTEYPESFTVMRSFAPQSPRSVGPPELYEKSGSVATFAIKVLFRQNASWQGSVHWLEGRTEQSFRSVLELLFLMDSALEKEKTEAS